MKRILSAALVLLLVFCVVLFVWRAQGEETVAPLLAEGLSVSEENVPLAEKDVQTISATANEGEWTLSVQQGFVYSQAMCLLCEVTFPAQLNVENWIDTSVPLPDFQLSMEGSDTTVPKTKLENLLPDASRNTVPYLVWFFSETPLFTPEMRTVLSMDLSLKTDEETVSLQVPWTIGKVAEGYSVAIEEDVLSGMAVFTPLSLRVMGTSSVYSTLDDLSGEIALIDQNGEKIHLDGMGTFSAGNMPGEEVSSVDRLIIFSQFLPKENVQSLVLGEIQIPFR